MYLARVFSMTRVIIARWENECISLSVLSMTQVMIAQWENECISLSVLSMANHGQAMAAKNRLGKASPNSENDSEYPLI